MVTEQHTFQAEVQQLLQLMIHSLYSEREIFLRELISNSADACDKLRFEALTDSALMAGDDQLRVRIVADSDAGTLSITDNGIGLTQDEAVEHLGTIARSGTKAFVEQLKAAGKDSDAASLIGQFGVGFYSSFMVAERVVVESRSARSSSDEGVRWSSTGDGSFETESIARAQRGTTITLHLKDDAKEFLETWRLRSLIKKYSDFVAYPVMLPKEVKEDEEPEDEQVNESQALWTRPKDDISDEQYNEFYRGACKQWDEPATRLHFNVEGQLEFTALLFIPSQKPMDLFERDRRGLNLYVRRVFIMDDCTDLLPEYLRFVRGVIDSSDLPLNVSREMLQQQAIIAKIKKILTRRILDHLESLARSEDASEQATFQSIDRTFGPVIREGLVNDPEQKERLSKLARYQSTWTVEQDEAADPAPEHPTRTGLADYVARMSEGQESIYYVTAPSLSAARSSPQLEGYRAKGYEVLLMTEPVDDYAMQYGSLGEFDGKKLVHIAKGAADLEDDESKKALEEARERYADFCGYATEQLPGIKEVRVSNRLTDSPACLVHDDGALSEGMEEMMRRFGQDVPEQERILELNPNHELVSRLHERFAGDNKDGIGDWLHLLRDQAHLAEGGAVKDGAAIAKRMQKLMAQAL
ncbi:MAG: molecular chaperone HtpG [Planctomycetota bacterium]|nr:MAG: molecular chaperone HtpG [Planctomycetota bacterium]